MRNDPNRKKIALVATAHHLSRVMAAMLRSGEVWREDAAPSGTPSSSPESGPQQAQAQTQTQTQTKTKTKTKTKGANKD